VNVEVIVTQVENVAWLAFADFQRRRYEARGAAATKAYEDSIRRLKG
jgi:hypothetical protein